MKRFYIPLLLFMLGTAINRPVMAQVNLESSNLPILIINTNGQSINTEEKTVDLRVIFRGDGNRNYVNSSQSHYLGKAAINVRGNSSTMFPKKAYSLKTINSSGEDLNFPMVGLPMEHKWVLHAAYNDKSLMRNYFAYRLSAEMGHYAPRTKFVEVVINGDYRGVYLLVEAIKRDKNRVNISKNAPETTSGDELTGGYIVRIDKNEKGREYWTSNYSSNTNGDKVKFQYEYPKAKDINQHHKNYIEKHFHDFEDALQAPNFKDPSDGYRKFINLKSFYDHFILNEASRDIDGYRISTYLFKDRDSKNGKLFIGPVWDYDLAWFNANYGGGNKTEGWQYKNNYYWTSSNPDKWPVPFWWRRFLEDPEFVEDLNCRYTKLRKTNGVLDLNRMYKIIDSVAQDLSEAADRNFKRWPVLGEYVWPNPEPHYSTYLGEVGKVKDWLEKRLDWMDKSMPGICTKDLDDDDDDDNNKDLGIKELRLAGGLKVYPNPFNNEVQLNYLLHEPAVVQIELLNSFGMVVKSFPKAQLGTGAQFEQFDAGGLSSGIYILVLRVNEKSFYQKLVKVS